jgi:hypothetical protein
MKTKLFGLILAALMLVGASAQAAVLSLSGGSGTTIPGNFNTGAFPPIPGIVTGTPITEFSFGSVGGLSVSGPANITFQYLGKDADFHNTFSLGAQLFSTTTSVVGDTQQVAAGGGLIPFIFHTSGGGFPLSATNGGPIAFGISIAFADLHDGTFLALFNDGGGSPDDRDFNDMIVRVSVSAVPLPAAAWLLISAVLGLVSFSRIRRSGAQSA